MACNICGVGLHKTDEHYLGWNTESLIREINRLRKITAEKDELIEGLRESLKEFISQIAKERSTLRDIVNKKINKLDLHNAGLPPADPRDLYKLEQKISIQAQMGALRATLKEWEEGK